MNKTIIYTQNGCVFCHMAKELLEQHNIMYQEYNISENTEYKTMLYEDVPNARTVPQIFLDGVYVGGYSQLKSHLDNDGKRLLLENQ